MQRNSLLHLTGSFFSTKQPCSHSPLLQSAGSSESNSALVKLVEELASGKLPHEVENASTLAQNYASRSAELIEKVRLEGKKMRNFAYFLTNESATGNVANFLMGAFNIPVGAAIREEEPGYLEISLRSSEESKHDLGKIVSRIALKSEYLRRRPSQSERRKNS